MGVSPITINLIKELNKKRGTFNSVLDVGCGDKVFSKYVDCNNYIGIEVNESGHEAKKIADHFFDGVNIPFEKDTFDLILCLNVLEHALEPIDLLLEMKRVLKPSGAILICIPFLIAEHEEPFDFRRYTSFGISKLAKDLDMRMELFEAEHKNVNSFIALGLGGIWKSQKNNYLKKLIGTLWLKLTRFLFLKILSLNMEGMHRMNHAIFKKN